MPAVAVAACLAALPTPYQSWWKANWRALAGAVDANRQPGDVLVIRCSEGPADQYPNVATLALDHYLHKPMPPVALLRHPPNAELARQLRAAGGVLYLEHPISRGPGDFFSGDDAKLLAVEAAAGRLMRLTLPRQVPNHPR